MVIMCVAFKSMYLSIRHIKAAPCVTFVHWAKHLTFVGVLAHACLLFAHSGVVHSDHHRPREVWCYGDNFQHCFFPLSRLYFFMKRLEEWRAGVEGIGEKKSLSFYVPATPSSCSASVRVFSNHRFFIICFLVCKPLKHLITEAPGILSISVWAKRPGPRRSITTRGQSGAVLTPCGERGMRGRLLMARPSQPSWISKYWWWYGV